MKRSTLSSDADRRSADPIHDKVVEKDPRESRKERQFAIGSLDEERASATPAPSAEGLAVAEGHPQLPDGPVVLAPQLGDVDAPGHVDLEVGVTAVAAVDGTPCSTVPGPRD